MLVGRASKMLTVEGSLFIISSGSEIAELIMIYTEIHLPSLK